MCKVLLIVAATRFRIRLCSVVAEEGVRDLGMEVCTYSSKRMVMFVVEEEEVDNDVGNINTVNDLTKQIESVLEFRFLVNQAYFRPFLMSQAVVVVIILSLHIQWAWSRFSSGGCIHEQILRGVEGGEKTK